MATIADIRREPNNYLGGGVTDEDAARYIAAVKAVMADGYSEEEACAIVWIERNGMRWQ